MSKIKIKKVKSSIKCTSRQKKILLSLGLKKMGSEVLQDNSNSIMGCVRKVSHLVQVEEVSK